MSSETEPESPAEADEGENNGLKNPETGDATAKKAHHPSDEDSKSHSGEESEKGKGDTTEDDKDDMNKKPAAKPKQRKSPRQLAAAEAAKKTTEKPKKPKGSQGRGNSCEEEHEQEKCGSDHCSRN